MITIEKSDYKIMFDDGKAILKMEGMLHLSGSGEYAPINELLSDLLCCDEKVKTIDLSKLEFLNSSGIAMLSRFMIVLRKKMDCEMVVLGSNEINWQRKSLQNLKRLNPSLKLSIS